MPSSLKNLLLAMLSWVNLCACGTEPSVVRSEIAMGLSGTRPFGALPVSGISANWKSRSFRSTTMIQLPAKAVVWQVFGVDNRLYVAGTTASSDRYCITCYDPATGKISWECKTNEEVINPFACLSSPGQLLVFGIPQAFYEKTIVTVLNPYTGKKLFHRELPLGVFSCYLEEHNSLILGDGRGDEWRLTLTDLELSKLGKSNSWQEGRSQNKGHYLVLVPSEPRLPGGPGSTGRICGTVLVQKEPGRIVARKWNGDIIWAQDSRLGRFSTLSGVGSRILAYSFRGTPLLYVMEKKSGHTLMSAPIKVIDAFETVDDKFVILDATGKLLLVGDTLQELGTV